uniref:Uncharacterized protein n=1 Tax=Aegilops tauschii subsp. strangulata TaxID=200361 RepID=A0A453HP61_AEGTS
AQYPLLSRRTHKGHYSTVSRLKPWTGGGQGVRHTAGGARRRGCTPPRRPRHIPWAQPRRHRYTLWRRGPRRAPRRRWRMSWRAQERESPPRTPTPTRTGTETTTAALTGVTAAAGAPCTGTLQRAPAASRTSS